MKKFFLFLISIFVMIHAYAETPCSNFYVDAFGGFNFVNSYQKDDKRLDLNSGYLIGGAFGYKFTRFFRLEGEAAYRRNTFDQMVVHQLQFPVSGSIRKVTLMVNGLLEIPLRNSNLIPYCGFGLGERWDNERFTIDPITTQEGTYYYKTLVSEDCGFACQAIVGLIFCAGSHVHAAVEYRYLDGSHIQANNAINLNLKRYF